MFDQDAYIETTKGIIKELFKEWFPETDMPLGLPNLGADDLNLAKPVIFIEYNSSINRDQKAGKWTGHNTRHKRKTLRYSVMVITTGESDAILQRDRISQKIEIDLGKSVTVERLAGQGLKDIDCRFVNAYKVREGVHLSRLEFYTTISIIS